MDPQANQFLNMDRQTPYLGCYRQQNYDPNIMNKKHTSNCYQANTQIKLKKMIGNSPFKPKTIVYQESLPQAEKYKTKQKTSNINMHTFQREKVSADIRFSQRKSQSHKNLPTKAENKTYHYESQYIMKPEFDLNQKRPPQIIQTEMQKLNRRKQFSRIQTENTKNYQNEKLETIIQQKIKDDKRRHPTKYIVLGREAGLQDKQIFKMKPANLNFQLQRYTKNKGLQYLYDNRLRMKARSNSRMKRSSTQPDDNLANANPQKKKYVNYIPQVFGNLKPKPKKQTISENSNAYQVQLKPPVYIDPKISKLNALSLKQQKIGKQILSKVKKHFKDEKQTRPNYFEVVKSEQAIDEKLIEFLRAKIDRAQVALT